MRDCGRSYLTWHSGVRVVQLPAASERGRVTMLDAVGLHVLVLRKIIECVDATLCETVVPRIASIL